MTGFMRVRGDACHPMLPYLAQGANSSLEDGAVLGRLLKYVTSREKLGPALKMYERLRKVRGEAIAKEALGQVSLPGPQHDYYRNTCLTNCDKEGLIPYA